MTMTLVHGESYCIKPCFIAKQIRAHISPFINQLSSSTRRTLVVGKEAVTFKSKVMLWANSQYVVMLVSYFIIIIIIRLRASRERK
jgi:hypothetical protein